MVGDYANLTIPMDAHQIRALRSDDPALGGGLKTWPLAVGLAHRLRGPISAICAAEAARATTAAAIARMSGAGEDAVDFGSGYGYEDDFDELGAAVDYMRQISEGREDALSESGCLYRHAVDTLGRLFDEDPAVRHFVNFGACYAHVDSLLAARHRDIRFVGVDRSGFTKLLNERRFSADNPNMDFVAGDILEFLEGGGDALRDGVLFHTRTGLLLPKSFLGKLYRAARTAGAKYVVLMEQFGISRQTWMPYEFSDRDQPSIIYRQCMYIHNYPGILRDAGYEVARAELLQTNHPHPDYRILSITARASE